ncbi:type IV pilus secretin PilQ [Bdellovibrio sp. qaytius]|nr:type IV pilus secretin PilQ [Bdellovibrio sp. qaytius]
MIKKGLTSLVLVLSLVSFSCSTKKKVVDDDFGVEDETGTELSLDDTAEAPAADPNSKDEFADFDKPAQEEQPAQTQAAPPPAEELVDVPAQPQEAAAEPAPQVSNQTAKISDVKFLGNSNGGTLVINADYPLQYKTRMNSNTNQLVVEVQNAIVPDRLKRALNTKDMTSNIGSIDIYQNANSNVARFVVQLRSGSQEPLVQPEGNTLLIVGSPSANGGQTPEAMAAAEGGESDDAANLGIMSSESIEDFLANNNKFYGRKISIETTDMDVRDILKFISEESGINMIFDDNIAGKVSLKLRKVPWDQALVTILKSKKLAYRRQGQVLRIGPVETLAKEEEDAIRLKEAKLKTESLVVKNFSINYADVAALEAKVKDFISEGGAGAAAQGRGKVTVDARTNSLIVTETNSKLAQVEKLISLLDSQPQQVLIEGRVVEASETYARQIGVNFGFNLAQNGDANLVIPGRDRVVTGNGGLSRFYSPSATFNPAATGSFTGSMWLGQFGAFGDLSTRLALDEVEEKVKILSSPRIAVLHNSQATIKQGSIIQVPSTETTTAGTTTTTQTFKEVEVGVNLDVKPLISSIGTVNLDLKIERSATTATGGRTQREIKTNIIVKSGETAVIGGVFTSDVTNRRQGVPGLKDIPILGTLFRTDSNSSQKTELMFFISPRILKTLQAPSFKASSQDLGEGTSGQ